MPKFNCNFIVVGLLFAAFSQPLCAQNNKALKGYPIQERLNSYKKVKLTTDTNQLSEAEKRCLFHLIKAAEQADLIFWQQAYMEKDQALKKVKDSVLKAFIQINYGPWDRLNNNAPFVEGIGAKSKGVNFYPADFDPKLVGEAEATRILSPYTIVNKVFEVSEGNPPPMPQNPDPNSGQMPKMLEMFPMNSSNGGNTFAEIENYGQHYQSNLLVLNEHMNDAANAIEGEDPKLAEYLRMRGMSLLSDQYIESDIAWLQLDAHLDIIIGPIENYEDKLTGQKTAYEAYVLVRDREWGQKLKQYLVWLPKLQAELPVEKEYKPTLGPTEPQKDENGDIIEEPEMPLDIPGFPPLIKPKEPQSQLAVFDAVYYGGDCNAGSKTIAVNLPNDEVIQQYWGTRRSQLKNTMRAKFDEIVMPISKEIIHKSQRKNINFDAFFNNVMFHEVAHGLGVKNLVKDPNKTVREALGPDYSAIEECKADVLGLYMVTSLQEAGVLKGKIEDFYVTFVASVYRSVRFGASSAHGRANMITFNTLMNKGCLERTNKGLIVKVPEMKKAIRELAAELLHLQGDGDVDGVTKMLAEHGGIDAALQSELDGIQKNKIPVDIVFEQGTGVLGLDRFNKK
jgi:hypothetical protein